MRDSKQHKLLSINIQLEAAQQDDGDEGHLHEDDVGDEGTAAEPREGTVSLVIPVTNDEVRSFQRSLRELGLGSVTGAAGPGSSRAPWGSSRRQRRRPPVPSMRLELPFSTREGIVFGFWQRCPYG